MPQRRCFGITIGLEVLKGERDGEREGRECDRDREKEERERELTSQIQENLD